MLVQLIIRNIVLIDHLDLSFRAGFTILTGETGAGKSILLDAFSLALGARGDGGLVREGESQGQVTAIFDLKADHPALHRAKAFGILEDMEADSSSELILRRIQMADGKTRAFINDQVVSVQTLKAIGAALVEIHGQHDDRALMQPAAHRDVVDAFGDVQGFCAQVKAGYYLCQKIAKEMEQEAARLTLLQKEADFLNHAFEELSRLSPQTGEEEHLADRRAQMMQAEKVSEDLREAYEALCGGSHTLIAHLSQMTRRLERRAAHAPSLLEPSLLALDKGVEALEIVGQMLEQALETLRFQPHELEETEERLFALRAASRKYAVPVDQLMTLCEEFSSKLDRLDAGETQMRALEIARDQARTAYQEAALALSTQRQKAAAQLEARVQAELGPLRLERARFITHCVADPTLCAPEGIDHVEFWVQTNPGTKPGPLMKIASGGELARFMLALKVALSDRGSAPTLVFDEIDTGVGGAVAGAIGHKLHGLSAHIQVLAVTHAPQVAAMAHHHLYISKHLHEETQRVRTQIHPLSREERGEEIARMLSGEHITQEARAAAHRLLEPVFTGEVI